MKTRRNRPISILAKELEEHIISPDDAKFLRMAFDVADRDIQKRVIVAYLRSSEWINRLHGYELARCYWEEEFLPILKQCWNVHKEAECGRLILQHAERFFVWQHLEELTTNRNYYFFCHRFGREAGFMVDKGRLRPLDYLRLCCNLPMKPDVHEAQELFLDIVRDVVIPDANIHIYDRWHENEYKHERECCSLLSLPRIMKLSPLYFPEIGKAYDIIKGFGLSDAVVWIEQWCRHIRHVAENERAEWRELKSKCFNDFLWNEYAICILIKTIREELFKSVSEQFVDSNPLLLPLIEKLGLKVDSDNIFDYVNRKERKLEEWLKSDLFESC